MKNSELIAKIEMTHDFVEGCNKKFSEPFNIRAFENCTETVLAMGVCKDNDEICVYTDDKDNYVIPLSELTNKELELVYHAILPKKKRK